MTPHEDFLDTTTLAREHLQNAAALFLAIGVLQEAGLYDSEIAYLARLGRHEADFAAQHFDETAQALEASQASEVRS